MVSKTVLPDPYMLELGSTQIREDDFFNENNRS
jgi:hypothetical protein